MSKYLFFFSVWWWRSHCQSLQHKRKCSNHKKNMIVPDVVQGQTALHWAARRGYASVVKELVSRGADVNAADHEVSPNASFEPMWRRVAHGNVCNLFWRCAFTDGHVYAAGRHSCASRQAERLCQYSKRTDLASRSAELHLNEQSKSCSLSALNLMTFLTISPAAGYAWGKHPKEEQWHQIGTSPKIWYHMLLTSAGESMQMVRTLSMLHAHIYYAACLCHIQEVYSNHCLRDFQTKAFCSRSWTWSSLSTVDIWHPFADLAEGPQDSNSASSLFSQISFLLLLAPGQKGRKSQQAIELTVGKRPGYSRANRSHHSAVNQWFRYVPNLLCARQLYAAAKAGAHHWLWHAADKAWLLCCVANAPVLTSIQFCQLRVRDLGCSSSS